MNIEIKQEIEKYEMMRKKLYEQLNIIQTEIIRIEGILLFLKEKNEKENGKTVD
ncbi:MAG: hypothetical protein ACTSUK_03920 [Promethearchaeota archaeon]